MIDDDFKDLRFYSASTSHYENRKYWDIYRVYSADLWIGEDYENNAVCELFDYNLNSDTCRFHAVYVEPSKALFRLYFADDSDISIADSISAFRIFVENNITWFNSVKFNDFREPLQPPIDTLYF